MADLSERGVRVGRAAVARADLLQRGGAGGGLGALPQAGPAARAAEGAGLGGAEGRGGRVDLAGLHRSSTPLIKETAGSVTNSPGAIFWSWQKLCLALFGKLKTNVLKACTTPPSWPVTLLDYQHFMIASHGR